MGSNPLVCNHGGINSLVAGLRKTPRARRQYCDQIKGAGAKSAVAADPDMDVSPAATSPSPALREREGPITKRWEGEVFGIRPSSALRRSAPSPAMRERSFAPGLRTAAVRIEILPPERGAARIER